MATVKKSGGWKSNYGGMNYKSSGGKVFISGTEKGKGIPPGRLPDGGGVKKGQVFIEGDGAGRGIPPKNIRGNGGGDYAAKHDDE